MNLRLFTNTETQFTERWLPPASIFSS
jgi:hypothetical protein